MRQAMVAAMGHEERCVSEIGSSLGQDQYWHAGQKTAVAYVGLAVLKSPEVSNIPYRR